MLGLVKIMKILITGGAGFIGSNLCDECIKKGHTVTVIDNLSTGKIININKQAKFYNIDITDAKLVDIFNKEKFDVIFHFAAQISIHNSINDPVNDAYINILGTINILNACIKPGVKKIIYASSAAVYGEPQYLGIDEIHPLECKSFYGLSKLTGEAYIKLFCDLYPLDYTILRFANVFGPRQSSEGEGGVISIFLNKMLQNIPPNINGTGDATRDFIYVKDIVTANLLSIDKASKEVINIGTGEKTSIIDLYNMMAKLLKFNKQPNLNPQRKGDIFESFYNITKCRNILQWQPQYPLEKGLKELISSISSST